MLKTKKLIMYVMISFLIASCCSFSKQDRDLLTQATIDAKEAKTLSERAVIDANDALQKSERILKQSQRK